MTYNQRPAKGQPQRGLQDVGAGLAGGPVIAGSPPQLAEIGSDEMLANVTGASAVPVGVPIASIVPPNVVTTTGAPVAGQTAVFSGPDTITGSGGGGGGASWVPLTDGSDPPHFITDGDGNLIYAGYGP